MSEHKAAGDLWSPIKDGNAGFVFLLLALAALAFAIYFFRYRPAPVSEFLPSAARFQQIAAIGAVALLAIAAAAALWQVISPAWQEDGSTLRSTLASVKDLNWAAVVLAAGLIVSIAAFYLLRGQDQSIEDFWQAHTPSLDGLRGYAVAIAGVLVTCIVVGSIIGFFWTGSNSEFSSIAPFTISGSDDKQRGMALATAYQAQVTELFQHASVLDDILGQDTVADPDTQAPDQNTSESKSLNVYQKLDLDLKFQGVDVGGILSGIVNWLAMRRALQITVAEQSDGDALVSGALTPDGASHIYTKVKGNEEIVAAVAYSKLRDRLIAQQPDFVALNWSDVRLLHRTILEVTRLRSQKKRADYTEHDANIATLIDKAPDVESLLTFGAEVAMKAGNVDRALAYLDRTRVFLDKAREERDRSRSAAAQHIEDGDEDHEDSGQLGRKFLDEYNSLVVQRERVISSNALASVELLNAGTSAETVFADAFAKHRDLMKVGAITAKQEITVAIVGGIPQRESIGYKFKSTGNWVPGKYGLDNYADTLGLIVTTLAPTAKLMFVPLGPRSHSRGLALTVNEAEITQAVEAAVKAKADIVLVPYTAFGGSWKTRVATAKKFSSQALIVSTAPSKLNQCKIIKEDVGAIPAAFVANVDIDGRFKAGLLSSDDSIASYPGAIWAPGMRIPRLTSDGTWQTTYGNPFAAATAAAAIANIASGSGIKEPAKLMDAIRGTLQRLDTGPEIGIVDQVAALKALSDPAPAAPAAAGPLQCPS
jgi:hypothetical protein